MRKHPHGRGEDAVNSEIVSLYPETPPRAWGRPVDAGRVIPRKGNTPTGVGKTVRRRSSTTGVQKHPHGRGEDRSSLGMACATAETPPRAWGRRSTSPLGHTRRRNTPTGVGKTRPAASRRKPASKHPHGRGEDLAHALFQRREAETPPRAWGRLKKALYGLNLIGNTPTGVGRTPAQGLGHDSIQKHPHGRGEDRTAAVAGDRRPETPPRAWGRPES